MTRFLNVNGPQGLRAPGSVGFLPRFLHGLVLGALADIRVAVLREDPRWQQRPSRLLLTIDECYVIAYDVWMVVPEFDHPDEVYDGE